jgi:hypothetical protein
MAQAPRKARSQHGEGRGPPARADETLGNLDRQEAPLEALARLIHPLVPVDNGHKGRSGDRRTQSQPHHVRPGNLHGRGPKDRLGGKQERRDGLTGHALTAGRRPTSLGPHDGRRAHMRVEAIHRFSLIATDPSRRASLNRASDHLGGSGEVPVMGSSRSSSGPSEMRLAANGTSVNVHVGHGLNGDDHDARCGRETHVDHRSVGDARSSDTQALSLAPQKGTARSAIELGAV